MMYPDGQCETVGMGGSFGVSPSMEKELMVGVMKTKVDDCQVCMQFYFGVLYVCICVCVHVYVFVYVCCLYLRVCVIKKKSYRNSLL